jgi:hypothetical protein
MPWYLIKAEFIMDDGVRFNDSAWVKADDYLLAAEQARKNRQWDLRGLMRRAEFEVPNEVRYAHFEAKKYNVRSRNPAIASHFKYALREEP